MRQRTISTMNLPSAASVPVSLPSPLLLPLLNWGQVLGSCASMPLNCQTSSARGGGRLLAADGATGHDIWKQRVEERVSPVRQSAERERGGWLGARKPRRVVMGEGGCRPPPAVAVRG